MNPTEIILHCSATPAGEDYTVADITRWHRERGFRTIGYHYVIYRDGSVHKGRTETETGAHCRGHNNRSIGICYIGGCPPRSAGNWNRQCLDTRTAAQKESIRMLVRDIRRRRGPLPVYGHRDFAAKPCPGFDAGKEVY